MKLSQYKIAIVGCGNLGGALVRGLTSHSDDRPKELHLYDREPTQLAPFDKLPSVTTAKNLAALGKSVDIIVVAVKPQQIAEVCAELKEGIPGAGTTPLVISVAAGITTTELSARLGPSVAIVRVMPNLPALIGMGMSGIYLPEGKAHKAQHLEIAQEVFSTLGRTVVVSTEDQMNVITALGGSGPAFICSVIEALADGAVKMGLGREVATTVAIQMVLGTAQLLQQEGEHPAVIRDKVASAGGTTIFGLHQLEQGSLRGTLMTAVEAATNRARFLAGEYKDTD